MIEIVLDENGGDAFLDEVRPIFFVGDLPNQELSSYRREARRLIDEFAETSIVIVKHSSKDFSINLFALALFIESCFVENNIEAAVFKVADAGDATEAYKPYVALTIALKYVIRLLHEDVKMIYKELEGLGYLGLEVKSDYLTDTIYLKLSGQKTEQVFYAENTADALVCAGILKALALAKVNSSIAAEIKVQQQTAPLDAEEIISKIINYVRSYIG